MALQGGRPRPPTARDARQQLTEDLLDLPELFAGGIAQPFVAAPPAPAPAPTAVGYDTVGVVFVHGVGSQKKGDTLREFATPLVDWVEEWYRARKMVSQVTWAELTPPHSDEPASAALILPEYPDPKGRDKNAKVYPKQRWILSEAWWAPRVAAPEFSTMLKWGLSRLPWLIEGLVRGARNAATKPVYFDPNTWPARIEQALQFLNFVAVSIIYLLAELILVVVLFVLLLIAQLPLFGLDRFVLVRLVRPLLLENVGDFYVFVYDRIQGVHIRQSIYETVNWLVDVHLCKRIVVAAHSGGTVVAVDALGTHDILRPGGASRLTRQLGHVGTLITFGAALNRAWDEGYKNDQDKPARAMPEYLHGPTKWMNFWTHFDWAHPGRPLDWGQAAGGSPGSIAVVNGLSPLTDHGGYFSNYEQFISRLAREVDDPAGSRFDDDRDRHDRRRRARVAVLTLWRAVAVLGALGAIVWRYFGTGRDAQADGLAVWGVLSIIPAVGDPLSKFGSLAARAVSLIGAFPGELLVALTTALITWQVLRGTRPSLTLAVGATAALFALRDPNLTSVLRDVALAATAGVAVLLVAAIAYYACLGAFFSAWNTKLSLLSARPSRSPDPLVEKAPSVRSVALALALKTIALTVIVLGLTTPFATAPGFADIPRALLTLIGS